MFSFVFGSMQICIDYWDQEPGTNWYQEQDRDTVMGGGYKIYVTFSFPIRPMAGLINWEDNTQTSQPPPYRWRSFSLF